MPDPRLRIQRSAHACIDCREYCCGVGWIVGSTTYIDLQPCLRRVAASIQVPDFMQRRSRNATTHFQRCSPQHVQVERYVLLSPSRLCIQSAESLVAENLLTNSFPNLCPSLSTKNTSKLKCTQHQYYRPGLSATPRILQPNLIRWSKFKFYTRIALRIL